MADMPARRHPNEATLVRIGGAAGVAGGLCWIVKSGSILATGIQPPLMLDLALPLLAASLVGVAYLVLPPNRRRKVVATAAWLAAGAGLVALTGELLGEVLDPFIAAWALALLTGQLCLLSVRPAPAPLTFWTGVATVPALLVGGALAEADERLLEVPLLCLGLAWTSIGLMTLRRSVDALTRAG
jgi:hypothetical protein